MEAKSSITERHIGDTLSAYSFSLLMVDILCPLSSHAGVLTAHVQREKGVELALQNAWVGVYNVV